MTAAQIVTLQIEAYNNRDIEGNMALFSENFKIINFLENSVLIDGKEAYRKMYAQLFDNSPNLFAEVISRIDFDNKVILHEYITGRNGSNEKTEHLFIFEVNHGKIEKIFRM